MPFLNDVKCYDQDLQFVYNLTSTYIDKSNEASMVAASVIMFVLAGVFFNLNLFSGISDVSAILDPKVRIILSSALSLLLPVMSYLFSEAKNASTVDAKSTTSTTAAAAVTDLTLQAGVILVWMLLVELLRKKVDEIRMKGISSSLQRAGRVVWLGSLVFFNIHSAGRKIVFGILWILCATTVVQRIAFTEFGKRSYAHGKNARLIASYMAQILRRRRHRHESDTRAVPVLRDVEQQSAQDDGAQLLKNCRYIVMGEDQLVKEATADGYLLNHAVPTSTTGDGPSRNDDSTVDDGSTPAGVVTVGDVWRLAETESDPSFAEWDRDQRLRKLCLSFALFKLLRRRFEQHEPLTAEETADGRDLIFKGLYKADDEVRRRDTQAVFQVVTDDVNFLSEYYHSVVPVIFAGPFFLLANYVLLPVVVFGLCLMTVFLCANGDFRYAIISIRLDNYTIKTGILNLTLCLLKKVTSMPPKFFFSLLDLCITFLLFIIFIYESVWELVVFLLSNWFMVALVCDYTARVEWRKKRAFLWSFRRIRWLRSKMSHGELTMKQFSVLNLRCPPAFSLPSALSLLIQTRTVPVCVKDSIMEYLVAHDHAAPISTGMKGKIEARAWAGLFSDVSWAFESKSIAEVILTWHFATTIFENSFPASHAPSKNKNDAAAACSNSTVAKSLSKYCAYLVMFHAELLPDNVDKTEDVVGLMQAELKESLGCMEFFFFRQAARVERIMKLKGAKGWTEKKVVKNGVTLGDSLLAKAMAADNDSESVWEMLAHVWTEFMVYLAPSSDEERMKGHENALLQGGEFITVLWALTTHTGISRQPMKADQVHNTT